MARPMSPCGGSIFTTSAPMSASSVPASGPAMKLASSMTRRPCSGFAMRYPEVSRSAPNVGSSHLEAGFVDDVPVHGNFLGDAGAEHVRSFGHDRKSRLGEFLAHVRPRQDRGELLGEAIDDRRRRGGRRVDA